MWSVRASGLTVSRVSNPCVTRGTGWKPMIRPCEASYDWTIRASSCTNSALSNGRSALPVSLPLFPEPAGVEHAGYEKKEKCGLFGVWGTDEAARLTYRGLFAQQHRGQESAGIAVVDGSGSLNGHAGMGLVSQVFTPRDFKEELIGHAAI